MTLPTVVQALALLILVFPLAFQGSLVSFAPHFLGAMGVKLVFPSFGGL